MVKRYNRLVTRFQRASLASADFPYNRITVNFSTAFQRWEIHGAQWDLRNHETCQSRPSNDYLISFLRFVFYWTAESDAQLRQSI